MVTHKEALEKALVTQLIANDMFEGYEAKAMEAAMLAYLDARGLVVVPTDPSDGMIEAGSEEKISREAIGMMAYPSDIYRAMLAAAPDPFEDETP